MMAAFRREHELHRRRFGRFRRLLRMRMFRQRKMTKDKSQTPLELFIQCSRDHGPLL